MLEIEDHLKRFETAVGVIQSLPKNGSYRPSYETMLRFYGLYKQAVCGPCTVSRPGFWDPIGRYKWEAWKHQGDMSREMAMVAYVDEMKKVAQEVIDTMEINEKTASFFHYFEPLYHVIHDMPRPPGGLLLLPSENVMIEGSDSEVFSDTLEQLDTTKMISVVPGGNIGLLDVRCDTSGIQGNHSSPPSQVISGGVEGVEEKHDSTLRTNTKTQRKELTHGYWGGSSGYMPQHSLRQTGPLFSRACSGQEDQDISESGPNSVLDDRVQQQIIVALWQLREDMQSVMERLDVVEGLASANEEWWPFEVSAPTLLLFVVCPLVAQGLDFLLRWKKRKSHGYT
ncbi:hypothetical protein DNTS_004309 [Danionella cerebrum]|uniref:ACB domain-containing protein n=1 Tax=Danionella cerebrum TaxID=2873325 RepID=A0A553N1W8_9TELE|nr:hypothetical protein DNTS_004309 [Danionella translucida]TRY59402.1 hypothetical protein DNTS_004309 [Danionella translucida]TRY59403.1 hypothetical protein DNTS_004309 [Danionella translucida]